MSALVVLLLGLAFVARSTLALAVAGGGCLLGAGLVVAVLATGAAPVALSLPLGPPGLPVTLAIDGLSGFFLLIVLTAAGASFFGAIDADRGAAAPALPVFVAGLLVTVLAGDGMTLVLGFEAMSLASFALVIGKPDEPGARDAGLLYLGIAGLAAVCLMPAMGLLAQGSGGAAFSAMRAHPPEGWRAAVLFVLVLVGAGAKAGLAPLHVWLPPAHAAAPAPASALMSGAMTKVSLYVLARVVFDLSGPATPLWWGLPLIVLGVGGAVVGALRGVMEEDLKAVLACSTVEHIGLIAFAFGLALVARSADLPALASLAMGAALLIAFAHGLFKPLLFLAAGAVQHGAGTRRLALLGGLIHRMPVTSACALAGLACLAGLPPGSGFAGEWTLLQAAIGALRAGGLWFQTLVCVAATGMALAVGLAAASAVRAFGVAFLGRPRSPRGAAAEETGVATRWAMIALVVVSCGVGLFPAGVLALGAPALRLLTGAALSDRASAVALVPQADAPGYVPIAVAALVALGVLGATLAARRRAVRGAAGGPAWDCGFGPSPPWLPFGDPATQYGPGGFAQPLRRALGAPVLGAAETVAFAPPGATAPARFAVAWRDPAERYLFAPLGRARHVVSGWADAMQFLTVRRTLAVMFWALVGFLLLVATVQQS